LSTPLDIIDKSDENHKKGSGAGFYKIIRRVEK